MVVKKTKTVRVESNHPSQITMGELRKFMEDAEPAPNDSKLSLTYGTTGYQAITVHWDEE